MARFDLIDPMVSGNKLYKLHYFTEIAQDRNIDTIVTLGGAYSNHLAATATFCKKAGLKCAAIIRGEKNVIKPSFTLQYCLQNGMKLFFVERQQYGMADSQFAANITEFPLDSFLFIPEGGYDPMGAAGASIMADRIAHLEPTHVCMAVGTATTLAGFCLNTNLQSTILGIPVLKGMNDIGNRISFLSNKKKYNQPVIFNEYHFGGYAKHQPPLISFMNQLYHKTGIPTDFVYTGKMMFGINDLLLKNYFPENSRIVCIHTGGLQGNKSLPKSILDF